MYSIINGGSVPSLPFSTLLLVKSQAIKTPNVIYCSGQIPLTPEGKLIEGTIGELTAQCCKNLEAVLVEAGSSLAKVVKVNIFLADMGNFAASQLLFPVMCLDFANDQKRL